MIDFDQFENGEIVRFHHGDHNPPKFMIGKIYETNDVGPYFEFRVFIVKSGAAKHYFYERDGDCEGEIRKITEAEKIMLGVK